MFPIGIPASPDGDVVADVAVLAEDGAAHQRVLADPTAAPDQNIFFQNALPGTDVMIF
jgi:hypothetical protein